MQLEAKAVNFSNPFFEGYCWFIDDVKRLRAIQEGFSRSGLLPAERLADAAYVCGSNPVSSHARQIDLVGSPYRDNTWQAKAQEGFDGAGFRVQWSRKR